MIHHITPYSIDKNLGQCYNKAISIIGDDDYACIRDIDTLFLTPEQPSYVEEYIHRFPDAGILTCFTNRISPLSKAQLYNQVVSEDSDIRTHINIANELKKYLFNTTVIDRDISGFLMVVSKKVWKDHPFPETGKAIGVDTQYGRMIRAAGLQILRMDGVYLWHTYRLMNGITDKKHLQP